MVAVGKHGVRVGRACVYGGRVHPGPVHSGQVHCGLCIEGRQAPQLAYTGASCCKAVRFVRARAKGLGQNSMLAAGSEPGDSDRLGLVVVLPGTLVSLF
jgi:hypothetical protein